MTNWFNEKGLYNAYDIHQDKAPATFKYNNKNKTIDAIWTTPGVKILRTGMTRYDDWDRRILWIDIPLEIIAGIEKPSQTKALNKRLQLNNLRSVKKYQEILNRQYIKTTLQEKLKKIEEILQRDPTNKSGLKN